VRILAATNEDLKALVTEGRFREDLYYRLDVIRVDLPPLRERIEDIPILARQFVERLSAEMGKEVVDLSEGALRVLQDYDWPGNVRELENAVERAMVIAREKVLTEEDFSFLRRRAEERAGWVPPANMTLREIERRAVEATLRRTGGNIKASAESLGIDRSTLYEKIKKYEIHRA